MHINLQKVESMETSQILKILKKNLLLNLLVSDKQKRPRLLE